MAGGSSRLDLVERLFHPLPLALPPLVSRHLRLGTGQRVQDARARPRYEMIELVGDTPKEAS